MAFVYFDRIYKDEGDLNHNQNLRFDFQVSYTLASEENFDVEEEDLDNLETRTVDQTHEFEKEWLIGGDWGQILGKVFHILNLINVPCYYQVVRKLTDEIWALKEGNVISELEKVEVSMNVIVWNFPPEVVPNVYVPPSVAPASDEAVEQHLETVVVENESYCVICMDQILVGSDVAAGRMPCLHVFHRSCVEAWLMTSGICPVCRAVFPF
ncbi:E3 ubiquitin-protein ligase SIRP1 [Cardamine amara subsp. amara]|uniref:RING-type E3 ubiquitin transferase n=1 Tax=Cardamine amara subsp. amara TaxID=228776 RepID=A0ABD1A6I3_CARAN